ncbi:3-isopropylmalate dehydrogenase [Labeo rohita]|uniref:3-isopropylmalate dehydrogenase n=1 Tax=Labeo rohita TaxID=84645 RepID=A0ABQ8L7W1_LABRO|nr:3-isopropylmalate dehydrogenase [Labeo rohita]
MRVSGPPKTGSEAPRAHGILSRSHATGFDAHETAAALASYSSPQVGVALRHISDKHHTIVSPDTQPLVRHYVPTVRSSPGTGVQTHYCHHRCFQDRLGCHLQRAGSFRCLDRPPTVLAHKLSGVVGSAPGPEEVPTYDSGQARVGQVRQHCDCGLHQPPGWCSLLSHVTTSPPPAALESTQTQVSTSRSHPWRSQSHGRFPVTTGFARRRVETPPPIGPTDLGSIRPGTGRPLCLTGIHPLPAVVRSNRGPPRYRRTGTQLAEGPAQVCVSPSEPHRTDLVQSQGGQGTDSLGGPLLAQQNLVLGPGTHGVSPSLAHSSEEGPPFSGEGHNLAPAPRSLEPPPLVRGCDQEDFRDLSPSVVNTLLQARAPSTRWLYDLKWRIFVNWCSSHGKDPQSCGIKSVLSFLQEGLDRHLSASTLKVHVAAISANYDLVGGRSVGKHDLIIRFLRGARRMNPPRPHLIPSCSSDNSGELKSFYIYGE